MSTFNYTTKEGETWTAIAYKMYGNVDAVTTLIQANTNVPLDPILPTGTILYVPIISSATSSEITTNLPPWK